MWENGPAATTVWLEHVTDDEYTRAQNITPEA